MYTIIVNFQVIFGNAKAKAIQVCIIGRKDCDPERPTEYLSKFGVSYFTKCYWTKTPQPRLPYVSYANLASMTV